MATLEETLRSLGLSAARGIPQLATGFVDLAALPFTVTGLLKPEQAVGSTAYLTSKGLLPPEQQGLLNQTTELLSGAMNPAIATKAALAKGGLLAVGSMAPKYGLMHRPMTVEGGAARLHEASKVFGEDVYGNNALQYFGSGLTGEKTSLNILKNMRGNPDAEITIYRGVPKGVKGINEGDWVTLDPKMAAEYGNVISKKVKAKDITTWPDSLVEFGYYPSK